MYIKYAGENVNNSTHAESWASTSSSALAMVLSSNVAENIPMIFFVYKKS